MPTHKGESAEIDRACKEHAAWLSREYYAANKERRRMSNAECYKRRMERMAPDERAGYLAKKREINKASYRRWKERRNKASEGGDV
ncbi:MAG: hypothetical protein LBH93_00430 [Chitinispirillales bacterium]|jgi:hypothetical protein|nr:hypothetical protein [Chitinispirillales bacterium]